jgi:uncharacterized ParB-like nuclease family protein
MAKKTTGFASPAQGYEDTRAMEFLPLDVLYLSTMGKWICYGGCSIAHLF